MILRLTALLVMNAVMLGSASAAQGASNFLGDRRDDPAILAKIWDFARCVAKKDPERTAAFLKGGQFAKPNNPEVRALAAANNSCLSVALAFNQVMFAGAASEALYHQNGFQFAKHPLTVSQVEELAALGSRSVIQGACVAAAQPREVDALLRTKLSSEEETRAVVALRQSVETCMPTATQTPEGIRAVIAAGAFPAVASSIKAAR